MGETTAPGGANPSTGEYVRALALIGGGLALVAATLVWLFSALVACGCTTPPAMGIVNQASAEAIFEWQTDGLFGTPLLGSSGTVPIPACAAYTPALDPRSSHQVTIVTAAGTQSLQLVARAGRNEPGPQLVIRPDGSIERAWDAVSPEGPACGP